MARREAPLGLAPTGTLRVAVWRLDYFAIDCGELPDGSLLLFEADVAMIVHAMDPPDMFPYKAPQMRKVFAAFTAMLRNYARPAAG